MALYLPLQFKIEDLADIHEAMRAARLATVVTATPDGLIGTPLPLVLDAAEGEYGTLYGHVARPNPQWRTPVAGEAMAVFMGPDAYVTPSWYATKLATRRVVPTWNYVAVHAYGPIAFFEDEERLLDVVTRLTNLHEQPRAKPWTVDEAPEPFVKGQLRGIVGLRMPITRLEGKRKMSQNRSPEDRAGVVAGLSQSPDPREREVATRIPTLS